MPLSSLPLSSLVLVALFGAGAPADDALRIEQLIHGAPLAVPAKPGVARNANKSDPNPDAALLGKNVRVRTVDGGLYAGTLQSADSANIVLRIELPSRSLNYALPRQGVSAMESVENAP